jgi:hypothetical protein
MGITPSIRTLRTSIFGQTRNDTIMNDKERTMNSKTTTVRRTQRLAAVAMALAVALCTPRQSERPG